MRRRVGWTWSTGPAAVPPVVTIRSASEVVTARCRALASSPIRRTVRTSAPRARSQGGSIGPSASRMRPSCGSPWVSSSSPRTRTSTRGRGTAVSVSYPAAAASPRTAGVARVPTGSSWSPLRHSWPRGRMSWPWTTSRVGCRRPRSSERPCSVRRTAVVSGGIRAPVAIRTASPSMRARAPRGRPEPLVAHRPGARSGDRPAVHRGGVEGGQVGEGGQGAASVRPRAASRGTATGVRRAARAAVRAARSAVARASGQGVVWWWASAGWCGAGAPWPPWLSRRP